MAKLTIPDFYRMKQENQKISLVVVYDYAMMTQVDQTEIEMVLVGDSASMIVKGLSNTVSTTLDEMIDMCVTVTRAAANTYVIGDMPYMSYELNVDQALQNAGRLMKEGFVDAVKLEGGTRIQKTIKAIVDAGIPVMGHIGLTPQTVAQLGGFKVQGKDFNIASQVIEDAFAVQEAGAFSISLEAIPSPLARIITKSLRIPTIGIGAGSHCDGQALLIHDLLGMFDRFTPKFVKKYAELGKEMKNALGSYVAEVREGVFPGPEHSYSLDEQVEQQLLDYVKNRHT